MISIKVILGQGDVSLSSGTTSICNDDGSKEVVETFPVITFSGLRTASEIGDKVTDKGMLNGTKFCLGITSLASLEVLQARIDEARQALEKVGERWKKVN